MPQILQEVSVRTIQHRLQKGSENAMSSTTKKRLIIKVMMKKRILFCNIYKHWTIADWRKVMFCNASTSRLVLRGYKLVRRPSGVSRYDSMYIIKTVKHPKSVIVWDDFSGDTPCRLAWCVQHHVSSRSTILLFYHGSRHSLDIQMEPYINHSV